MLRRKGHFESPLCSAILKVSQRNRGDFLYTYFV